MEALQMRAHVDDLIAIVIGDVGIVTNSTLLFEVLDTGVDSEFPCVYIRLIGVVCQTRVLDEILEVTI